MKTKADTETLREHHRVSYIHIARGMQALFDLHLKTGYAVRYPWNIRRKPKRWKGKSEKRRSKGT